MVEIGSISTYKKYEQVIALLLSNCSKFLEMTFDTSNVPVIAVVLLYSQTVMFSTFFYYRSKKLAEKNRKNGSTNNFTRLCSNWYTLSFKPSRRKRRSIKMARKISKISMHLHSITHCYDSLMFYSNLFLFCWHFILSWMGVNGWIPLNF